MQDEKIVIAGPAGNLQSIICKGMEPERELIAILCHPHPQQQGTMYNKVVTTLHRTFRDLQITTIRFNFRGVGESEGCFAEAIGEVDDLRAVVAWAKKTYPTKKICLAGFSFGSFIAAKLASEMAVELLISVAPAVHHNDFANLSTIHCPWIVVQNDDDEVVPAEQVYTWVSTREEPLQLIRYAEGGHFFHGRLIKLREDLTQAISACETL